MGNTTIMYVLAVCFTVQQNATQLCFTVHQNATQLRKPSQNRKISFQIKGNFPFSVARGVCKK